MIKKFFSNVLGSFVGAWLALVVFSFMAVMMGFALIGSMAGDGSSSDNVVQEKSVLHLNLMGGFDERVNSKEAIKSALLGNGEETATSLETILKALRIAKDNENINGVFIECKGNSAGLATLFEIRKALQDFKKSGKFVYAYGNEGIAQSDYYLASVADSILLNPVGLVDIHGLSSTIPFFKNLLDKLGVEMQILRVGTFKSAVEPYVETQASPANRMATETYMKSIWGNLCDSIANSRSISTEKLNELASSLMMTQKGEYFVSNKIVDGLKYRFEVIDMLKSKTEIGANNDLRLVTPEQVAALDIEKVHADKVAVVYAVGEIDGTSEGGVVSSTLVKDIIEIANDDAVKAVVLRVNSPGGSAFGSEQIWAALEEVKKKGKPFAVSMGDLAASGGYYISCGADRIFAEPVTLTGSIGIFGMVPCIKDLMNDKLGVTLSVINTNENGNFISLTEPMTPVQREAMQRMINEGYELFTSRCATGRGMELDSLKMIAEGRVWDGITAKKLGLVDEFGDLNNAIDWVVEKAKVGEYSVAVYPKEDTSFMSYLRGYVKMGVDKVMETKTGELYKYRDAVNDIINRDHIQCLMEPVVIK